MVVSINTLYLYDNLIHTKVLTNLIDTFLKRTAKFNEATGKYEISALADFDGFLRENHFNKSNEVEKWINEILKSREE